LRQKRRETEEDSVSCPMKYSTDVECRSDSLAVISYRDINEFTHVNSPYVPILYPTNNVVRYDDSCMVEHEAKRTGVVQSYKLLGMTACGHVLLTVSKRVRTRVVRSNQLPVAVPCNRRSIVCVNRCA
jgi:hypothetical protein